MLLLVRRDEDVVLVFSFFFGSVFERRDAVAVLFVVEPLSFVL